ncbi:hypothetical protein M3685_24350 [Heyndrickxia oleronia]|uniref:Uncharacterized protein n=1 Tax=Heyndrickxia oleronia TaxID=38875 RepID=A0A8E2I4Z1_9BACI|nr:hypothetical protein [Heyndrickxia oleronia]OJH16922.1 hypothetical protein BLX88_21245 [Bacillus obstructivus]MCM3457020.1 hypothetical protein [Heyndrickxia oleronia]MEC1372754.1 hypothetical protein [Heyndrickxia oleronia]OOP66782.1 hypothetical protein BWZ43_19050 [Heyndrickxia oleronia]QQZ03658.1 hypothetical protein I5818_18145 [Heyndrickxia oleronia]
MFMGMQTLPVVYVDNNTIETLENVTITFDGDNAKEPTLKKLKVEKEFRQHCIIKWMAKKQYI